MCALDAVDEATLPTTPTQDYWRWSKSKIWWAVTNAVDFTTPYLYSFLSPPPSLSYRKDLRFALLTTSFYCCISWWNYSSWINTGFIGRVVIKPLKHLFCGIISLRSMTRYMAVKNKEYKLLLNTRLKYTAGVKKCQVHEAKFEINTISFSWGNNYGKPPPDCIGFNTRASLHCQSVCSKLYD